MSASEKELGALHAAVANYLTRKVKDAIEDLDKPPPAEDEPFVMPRTVGAAELNASIALLKNSNITCKRNVGSELDELDAALAASTKGRRGKPTDNDIADAIDAFSHNQGVH